MVALLDTNLLVALAWPNHVHHEIAQGWFARHHRNGWATCPITESSFVRVSSNLKVTPEARGPHEAILLLRRIVALAHHEFWTDDIAFSTSAHVDPSRIQGYRQVTDAHLLALALRHTGRLATLDGGIRGLLPRTAPRTTVVCLLDP